MRYSYQDPWVKLMFTGQLRARLGVDRDGDSVLFPEQIVETTGPSSSSRVSNKIRFDAENLNRLSVLTLDQPGQFQFVQAGHRRITSAAGAVTDVMTTPLTVGRSVHSLVIDKTVASDVRKAVSRAYTEKLSRLESLLITGRQTLDVPRSQYPANGDYFQDHQIDGLSMLEATLVDMKSSGKILIKSDNVIVDPFDLNKLTVTNAL
jgi:hypothetical protein